MLRRICVWVCLAAAIGCAKSPAAATTPTGPTTPTDFTLAVTSPNTNVFFNATEQMTATASDGRALTGGLWSSDNVVIATVDANGLVTPVGAGLAHIVFTASTGQQQSKLIRGLPSLAGTFSGSWAATACEGTGDVESAIPCEVVGPITGFTYTFIFMQNGDVVSGRFFIGGIDFGELQGTIDLGGSVSFSGHGTDKGIAIDATWTVRQVRPQTLGGDVVQTWTIGGLSGELTVGGSIRSMTYAPPGSV